MLSQCNTVLGMRLTNHHDQDVLRGIISDSSLGLLESLPSLGNAEAIAIGEGVTVPMRLCFDPLPEGERPRGETADFIAAWQRPSDEGNLVGKIVRRWRWRGQ